MEILFFWLSLNVTKEKGKVAENKMEKAILNRLGGDEIFLSSLIRPQKQY